MPSPASTKTRNSASPAHVAVIGAGVTGLCAAWYLKRSGSAVTVFERETEMDGCSFGNAGFIVPSHFVPLANPAAIRLGLRYLLKRDAPFAIRPRPSLDLLRWGWHFTRSSTLEHVRRSAGTLYALNLESRRLFTEFAEADDFGLEKRGLLMLCRTAHGLEEAARIIPQAHELGLDLRARLLNAAEVRALEPDLNLNTTGAVHFEDDCQLSPEHFMRSLRNRLTEAGVEFRQGCEVTGFGRRNKRITTVDTADGNRTKTDAVVLAAGSWSTPLGRQLGVNLLIQPGKGYSITLSQPRILPRISAILAEDKVAVAPMIGSLRISGTLEVGGKHGKINSRRVAAIKRAFTRYHADYTFEGFDGIPVWSGQRPCSADGMPYLGMLPGWENAAVSSGHAMMGLSLGPVSGLSLARLLSGEQPPVPLNGCEPGRFGS